LIFAIRPALKLDVDNGDHLDELWRDIRHPDIYEMCGCEY
jgi:hypothetical protein